MGISDMSEQNILYVFGGGVELFLFDFLRGTIQRDRKSDLTAQYLNSKALIRILKVSHKQTHKADFSCE